MTSNRKAGILLHITSLPGKFGIGDLGSNAYKFVDFLESSGQKLWQILPIGPTGYGDSPYSCFSAFAGNHLFINPELLIKEELLSENDLSNVPEFIDKKTEFSRVKVFKNKLFKKAFKNFISNENKFQDSFGTFCYENAYWLDDYAFYMSLKDRHNGNEWSKWERELVMRDISKMNRWSDKLKEEIDYHKFLQFIFSQQWNKLKKYANYKDIKIIGDVPIFVAFDSSEVWGNKHLFTVEEDGKPITVAGVPPDYFSPTGQLWGNPLYKWKEMEKDNYLWWVKRIRHQLKYVDILRIDHFRGFDAFWEIPGGAPTAEKGRWVKGPGAKLFNALKEQLGELPIIAEDLGIITGSVNELRDKFNFPGMNILQFAFGSGMETRFLPHNIKQNSVVYTGTHDNNTTRGYFEKEKNKDNNIYSHAQEYLNYYGDDITQELIRIAYSSSADNVIIPMQDILNLDSDARMNFPGTLGGNWQWRFTWEQITSDLATKYKRLTELYERPPQKKSDVEIEVEE